MKLSRATNNGKPVWRVSWMENGRQRRRFFRSKTAAEAFGAQTQADRERLGTGWLHATAPQRVAMLEALQRAQAGGYTLAQACDLWEDTQRSKLPAAPLRDLAEAFVLAKAAQGLRPRSLRYLTESVERFTQPRAGLLVDAVTPDMIAEHLDRPEWSQRSRRGHLVNLSTFFGWCVSTGRLRSNPAAGVLRPIVEVAAPVVLTPAEAERLVRAAEEHDGELVGIVAISLFAGLRPESEIWRLTPADITDAHIVVGTAAKTRRRRLVAIRPNLAAFLSEWRKLGCDLLPVDHERRVSRLRVRAGFETWTQDAARHSFVSYLYALDGEATAAAQAGHSAQMLHQHYRGLVTAADAERFFAIMPRGPYKQRVLRRLNQFTKREL